MSWLRREIHCERGAAIHIAAIGTLTMLDLISAKTLGARLELHASTVRRLARLKVIPSVKVGGSIRFDPEAVEQWLRREGGPAEKPTRHVFLPGAKKRKRKGLEMRAGL